MLMLMHGFGTYTCQLRLIFFDFYGTKLKSNKYYLAAPDNTTFNLACNYF
jgi:hypothetical protein